MVFFLLSRKEPNSRVLIFTILGIILIVLSNFYSDKHGENLKGDLDYKNFKNKTNYINNSEKNKTES
ncbi:MAG: hypothetical protein Q9M94_07425 [Candidatus Gracilibacteria bacterium]|nr:hypothetical protein [Candidatus Gracilibacteria bacterium]